ncbi:hypothetical protein O7627_03315 [Solwaraspora sp. WMMD1047]|uniref:hypothetical protein n=1 Tax=Solwaraspora sp. WMMD1047 TaxID=3016102 RepID=UPI0024172E27|nr:hypothetical protein [Solwaraspora sp. WMMD1047]MDG4828333.1 hypothetical protein [Solwaraspora sp. WMMD1047]
MSAAPVPDPAEALRAFVSRVAPYDPDPAARPVATVGIRSGHATDQVTLTPYLVDALVRALAGYRDPADRGGCADCGGRLDDNLHCPACGRLHGVLGEVIAQRAARVRSEAAAARSEGVE